MIPVIDHVCIHIFQEKQYKSDSRFTKKKNLGWSVSCKLHGKYYEGLLRVSLFCNSLDITISLFPIDNSVD